MSVSKINGTGTFAPASVSCETPSSTKLNAAKNIKQTLPAVPPTPVKPKPQKAEIAPPLPQIRRENCIVSQ
jgi:hypothetical protein